MIFDGLRPDLGQLVMTLVNGKQSAGYHQEMLNAGSLASGAYVYRVVAEDSAGNKTAATRRLMVLR